MLACMLVAPSQRAGLANVELRLHIPLNILCGNSPRKEGVSHGDLFSASRDILHILIEEGDPLFLLLHTLPHSGSYIRSICINMPSLPPLHSTPAGTSTGSPASDAVLTALAEILRESQIMDIAFTVASKMESPAGDLAADWRATGAGIRQLGRDIELFSTWMSSKSNTSVSRQTISILVALSLMSSHSARCRGESHHVPSHTVYSGAG